MRKYAFFQNARTKLRAAALIGILAIPGMSYACDIPVFQYALDYWTPDRFRIVVVHDGPMDESDRAFFDRLAGSVEAGDAVPNFEVEAIDLVNAGTQTLAMIPDPENLPDLPCLIALSPPGEAGRRIVASGPLTEETLSTMTDSPLRHRIGQDLVDGAAAVWVLLESGSAEKDHAAYETLGKLLPEISPTLELPGDPPEEGAAPLSFPIHRLSREDPAEGTLVRMLLTSEPDLQDPEFAGEPMAFPVFGRGRALYALLGAGINADTIREACVFLSGACSCQVKELNPGSDLLLPTDWGEVLEEGVIDSVERTLSEPAIQESTEEEVLALAVSEPASRNTLLALAAIFGIVAVGSVALLARGRRAGI